MRGLDRKAAEAKAMMSKISSLVRRWAFFFMLLAGFLSVTQVMGRRGVTMLQCWLVESKGFALMLMRG